MFSLSGPCELSFLLCLIASWILDLSCGECDVTSLYFMFYFIFDRFVNCLVKQFAMCLGVVAILLLNVMKVINVDGGALLDIPCMVFRRMCVL